MEIRSKPVNWTATLGWILKNRWLKPRRHCLIHAWLPTKKIRMQAARGRRSRIESRRSWKHESSAYCSPGGWAGYCAGGGLVWGKR